MRVLSSLAVVVAAFGVAVTGAAPASADRHCPDPGGAAGALPEFAPADPDADWVLEGRGWGHGAGMSQYGALGAARQGCTAATILATYFAPAAVGGLPAGEPDAVRVSLLHAGSGEATWDRADVTARSGSDVTWQVPGGQTHTQSAGVTWQLEPGDDDPWRLINTNGETVWSGGQAGDQLLVPLDGAPMVEIDQKDGRPYGQGTLRFELDDDAESVYASVAIGGLGDRPALDRYLDGLREVPRSWHEEALKAQIITARGYAANRHAANPGGGRGCPDCHLVDSPADQVYAGFSVREGAGGDVWRAAVDATSGQVVRHGDDIATTFYSSSHGGQSESGAFSAALGVDRPYLQPVDDSAWEAAAADANPHLAWTREVSDADVADAVEDATGTDVGEVVAVRTAEPTGAGGRVGAPAQGYGGVEVEGTAATATLSGWEFVSGLELRTASGSPGLRSELFEVFPGGLARLAGAGRVDTAAAAALDGWGDDGASTAVLATAWDFADALAATALAARLDAPVLLTPGTQLAARVADTLDALDVETVTAMGGPAALSTDVTDALTERGYAVERIAGATRFDTAAQAATFAASDAPLDGLTDGLLSGSVDEVAIALGTDWPDALAAGALGASSDRVPTLLTAGDTLHDATSAALDELDPDTVHLVGGTAVLSDDVAAELRDAGYDVHRFAGSTRFATSAEVAAEALTRDDRDAAVLASGLDFPDALAAGAYSARVDGVLALVARDRLDQSPPTRDLIDEAALTSGTILGGPVAVSDDVRREGARLLAGD